MSAFQCAYSNDGDVLSRLLFLVFTVALAGVYLGWEFHQHMFVTGQATIHGSVGAVGKIQEKCIHSLKLLPDVTVNMVVPYDNMVDDAIWSYIWYIDRDREDAHSVIHRDWFSLKKKDRDRLNVFAAQTLYDVLELVIIAPPGM